MPDFAFDPGMESTAEVELVTTVSGEMQLRRTWQAPDPRALVLIVHGIAEHSGRYEHVARQLTDAGFSVVAYDQRGHGQTEAPHVTSFMEFHDDLQTHLSSLKAQGLPTIVLGHSMGGLVTASYALTERPQADLVVLSAPALAIGIPRLLRRPIRFLGRRFPNRTITLPLKPEALAADARVGRHYAADPHVNLKVTLGLVGAMVTEIMWLEPLLADWSARALVVHGLDDEIVKPAVSESVAASPVVDRRAYPGLRHEALNEVTGPTVVADIIGWIDGELATDDY